MFVIGVAGQAQMGKDTLSDHLANRLNENIAKKVIANSPRKQMPHAYWRRTAFASNVKKVFCDTFGVDLEFVEKWKTVKDNPPGFNMPMGESLQFIGDGFSKIKQSIWLDLIFKEKDEVFIISDVRYVNEFVRCKEEGGINILIGRPDKLNYDENESESQIRPYVQWCLNNLNPDSKFVSLKDIDWNSFKGIDKPEHINKIDFFVRNDSNKEDLYKLIDDNLVSFVENYVFEFPSIDEEKEIECLIST